MNKRYGMSVGLVGLLLSAVAFGAGPVASQTTDEVAVATASPEPRAMEEIVVTARRPDAEPKSAGLAMQDPLELLRDSPIHAPELADELLIKPEIRLIL